MGGSGIVDRASKVIKTGSILSESCGRACACRMHLLHSGHVINAVFREWRPGRVILHVNPATREDSLQPEAMCCVAFPYLQSLYAFVACVKRVRDGETALEVHFDEPPTLTVTNLRRSYRVPVIDEAEIELIVHWADNQHSHGKLSNISESGFEATLQVSEDVLAVDTEVQCELKFREDNLMLPAVVRRRKQSQFALQFTLARELENRPAIVAIQKVVRTLEQLWLKSRKRELSGPDAA